MTADNRYQPNEPNVIQEVIDGEAIIADLGKGLYFSLDDLGSRIWAALVNGCSTGEITEACTARFSEDAASDVQALFDRLLAEELIVPAADVGGGDDSKPASSYLDGFEGAWTAPQLSKYTDMEQLLLLDPIHEVDETGWPNTADAERVDG